MSYITRRQMVSLAAVAGLPGCGKGIDVAEWTEEVMLHDGRIIDVWRRARAYSSGFPNANRGAGIDFELRYEPMKIYWQDNYNRSPLSFDIIDGIAYLTNHVSDRATCAKLPDTAYTAEFLRWDGRNWVHMTQSEFPIDKALLNLSGNFWGHSTSDDYKGLIKWEEKRLRGKRSPVDTIQTYFERGRRFCGDNKRI